MDDAVGAERRAGRDRDVTVDHRAGADGRAGANGRERPDGHIGSDHRARIDDRQRADPWRRAPGRREQRDRFGKRQIGLAGAQHGTRRVVDAVVGDDRRGARRRQLRRVFGVGEERDFARLRVFDPGDARHLDIAVAFETAPEALGKFGQRHGGPSIRQSGWMSDAGVRITAHRCCPPGLDT